MDKPFIVCGVDPGINECAYAVVEVTGNKMKLLAAVLVPNTYTSTKTVDKKRKIAQMARELRTALSEINIKTDLLCVELTTAALNHDTLARMAFASGVAIGATNTVEIAIVSPPTWKDVSDKFENHEVMYKRMTPKFRASLDTFLKQVPNGKQHNVVDAVGIAVWAAKNKETLINGHI